MQKIYLDNNATTEIDPKVREVMLEDLTALSGNASSLHSFGRKSRELIENARYNIASFFQTQPEEIIFTSGGTEGLNQLIRGLGTQGHIISTEIEHAAVYKTLRSLEIMGLTVTYVPVDLWGAPKVEKIEEAIRPETKAIVLSLSNAETGVKIDLEEIDKLAQKKGISLILDAVSYIGKDSFSLLPSIKGFAISGHKIHGPKGIGLIYCRSDSNLIPFMTGGGQEFQKRPGTENTTGILGLNAAIEILKQKQSVITEYITSLRHYFETSLFNCVKNLQINGEGPRVSNTSNIFFPEKEGQAFLVKLDQEGVSVSQGSACSKTNDPSRILTHMGIDAERANCSLRFSFSRMNKKEEIDLAIEKIEKVIKKWK